jgi:AcrR family transcriptional regulator
MKACWRPHARSSWHRGSGPPPADVAQRAGVSEGILFHRFKSKEALFRAALNPELDDSPEMSQLSALVGQRTVAENLCQAASGFIEILRERLPALMVICSNPGPEGIQGLMREMDPPGKAMVRLLASDLGAEMRRGRLRRVDAEVAARALIGGIFDDAMETLIHGPPEGQPLILSQGIGAGCNRATAGVVVGGQTLPLLLTLLATPVFYSLIDDLGALRTRLTARKNAVDRGAANLDAAISTGAVAAHAPARHAPRAPPQLVRPIRECPARRRAVPSRRRPAPAPAAALPLR